MEGLSMMLAFVRGMQAAAVLGDGLNLPIFNRIAVKYQDRVVMLFFSPASAILLR
jgi:hypothetical protein